MFFFSYSHVAKIESEISIEINYFSTNFESSIPKSKYCSYTLFSDNCVSSNVFFLYLRIVRRSNPKFRSKLIILSSSSCPNVQESYGYISLYIFTSVLFQMILLAIIYSHFSTQTLKLGYLNLLYAFSKNRSSRYSFSKNRSRSNILFSYFEYLYSLQILKFRYLNPNTRFPDNCVPSNVLFLYRPKIESEISIENNYFIVKLVLFRTSKSLTLDKL